TVALIVRLRPTSINRHADCPGTGRGGRTSCSESTTGPSRLKIEIVGTPIQIRHDVPTASTHRLFRANTPARWALRAVTAADHRQHQREFGLPAEPVRGAPCRWTYAAPRLSLSRDVRTVAGADPGTGD